MNVVVEDAGTCRKTIQIEWPADRVRSDYDAALKQYCKMARISGFRPGKAPVAVVEKRFAKQIVEDVRDRLVPEGYQQAIKEKELRVLKVTDVTEASVELGAPLSYTVSVEVAPDFDLPEYRGVRLTRETEPVAEDKIDETIDSVREQFASFDEVSDRPVQKGDLVQVDFEGFCENQPIEELCPEAKGLGQRENFWVRADENAFLPEFTTGLLGAQPGEKRQVQVDFPEDFAAPELKGKQATYFVEVKGLREKKLPPLDAAFFERLGMADEAALRARIREDMEQAAEDRETARLRNAAIDYLLKDLEMDLPPTALAFETQRIIENVVRDNTSRGIKESELVEKKGEIMEMAQRNAESRVKVKFLLDRIAEQEKIEVSARDVEEQIQRMAGGYGMSPTAFRAELKKRDALEALEEDLRRSKTIDLIMEQAVMDEPAATQEKQ